MIPRLYPIIDADVCRERGVEPLALARRLPARRRAVLQLRGKDGSSAAFLDLAERVVAARAPRGAPVIVNDRADIARAGAAPTACTSARTICPSPTCARSSGRDAIVGLSTHDARADRRGAATSDASYIAVGPVFGTATKETGYAARGLDLVRVRRRGRGKPVVAIGGITLEQRAVGARRRRAVGRRHHRPACTGDPEARARAVRRAPALRVDRSTVAP